ncbi:nucleotidyltransferase family protein [Paenibacillaceae bacterium WGS1546]|uniref:nucleotidyltransferase family protein n=1 Tax=Cohnella sp. WGS1546 TaxID=3366810 RepID=UPI00372D6DC3
MITTMNPPAIKPEHELVLELSQFRNRNREKIVELLSRKLDLAEILGHLTYNRTAGIAYHVLRQIEAPSFNREFEMALYLIHQIQSLRTSAHKKHISQLAKAMNESGIPHAFLKGAILANSVYPEGCRISSDIDILLNAGHLTECSNIFKSLGFIQGFHDENKNEVIPATRKELINYRMNFGEVVPFRKVIDEPGINLIEIDINFSLNWLPHGTEEAVENFILQAQMYDFPDGQQVSSLPPEYFLAHLCVHLFKEAHVITWVEWQRDLGLYKFVDLYGFLTDSALQIDWNGFIRIVRDNDIVKESFYALEYARTFFPVLNDNRAFIEALEQIKPDNTDYLEQVIDGGDASIVYRWTKGLLPRFFDMHRYDSLERV